MRHLAIGPRREAPSWQWIGQSLADRLASRFRIEVFDDFEASIGANVVLVVKQRPSRKFMSCAQKHGVKVAFAPVDVYNSEAEIAADAEILRACSCVLVHSDALRMFLQPYCAELVSIDHHTRFSVHPSETTWDASFILWVGALQHVPHLVEWHERVRPPCELLILSDIDDPRARLAAHAAGHELGIRLRIDADRINGISAKIWTPERQRDLMKVCRAAVDIKGKSFAQRTKPPTKAQQFVASGIPFGANEGHPAIAWFRDRSFDIADAADWNRLLSPGYRAQTQIFAHGLRKLLSIEAVEKAVLGALTPLWSCRNLSS